MTRKCNKYEGLMERYLTGEILPEERDSLEQHISLCPHCSATYDGVSEIDALLRRIPADSVTMPPYLKTKIMSQIEEMRPEKSYPTLFRPLYAAAAALLLFVLVALYGYMSRPVIIGPGSSGTVDYYTPQFKHTGTGIAVKEVKIIFYGPDVRNVSITGDFNNWDMDGLPLTRRGRGGLWEIDLRLLQGVYSYNFIIDGKILVPDPTSPNQAPDGFGGMNSVMYVYRGETI